MDTSGDDTITSSSRGKAPAPPPEDHEETLGEADRASFQESFEEGLDIFLPTGSREKVEEDIATSLHNTTELINVWTDQGYRVPAALTDNFVTEILQAAYTASEIGLIKHAVQDGGSHSSALQQIIKVSGPSSLLRPLHPLSTLPGLGLNNSHTRPMLPPTLRVFIGPRGSSSRLGRLVGPCPLLLAPPWRRSLLRQLPLLP